MPASWYVGSDWTARIAPKQHNPLALEWQDQPFQIRSILLSEIDDGRGLSLLIDLRSSRNRWCCSLYARTAALLGGMLQLCAK